jgi:hypothetical protein
MIEEWRKYKDFDYEVSNLGNVRRTLKNGYKKLKIVDSSGRAIVGIWKENKGVLHQVSRLVAETFFDEFTKDCVVMHLDNNPLNNCLSNLKCGNQSENVKQSYTDKRRHTMRHDTHPMKKLTKDIVIEVRELFNKGYSASEILSELNLSVAKSTLYSIKQNKSWMDL